MTADYPDYLPPAQQMLEAYFGVTQQIAALIATGSPTGTPGGVPLLAQPESLYYVPGFTLAPSATGHIINDLNSQPVHAMAAFLSYEISITQACDATADSPFITYTLSWYADLAATILLWQENWTIPGASNRALPTIGTGPVRGAYLQVTASNESTIHSNYNVVFALIGNSRPAPEPSADWRTLMAAGDVIAGYTVPNAGKGTDDVLGIFSLGIPVSSIIFMLCDVFNGPIEVSVNLVGVGLNCTLQFASVMRGSGLQFYGPIVAIAASPFRQVFTINAPQSPLIVWIQNNNAANTVTGTMSAIAAPAL